jgi:hypothetical protein
MPSTTNRRFLPALLGILILASSCTDAVAPETPPVDPFAELRPGIYPTLVVLEAAGDTATLGVEIRSVGEARAVSSVQLVLSFDPSSLTLLGAVPRSGLVGAWSELEPGRIRLAAASLNPLGSGPVLTLHALASAPLDESRFSMEVEELVATDGFHDLTPEVPSRAHPVFCSLACSMAEVSR